MAEAEASSDDAGRATGTSNNWCDDSFDADGGVEVFDVPNGNGGGGSNNDEATTVPTFHEKVDIDFFSKLIRVDPAALSPEEQTYTDADLLALTTGPLRELATKCKHTCYGGKNGETVQEKTKISKSGNTAQLCARILAFYHFLRWDDGTDKTRPKSEGGVFNLAEDARLIEIFTDPTIASDVRLIFQSGSRQQIDSVSGSLVDATWNGVVAGRYFNNFHEYMPPYRHSDPNDLLHAYDPNDISVNRRSGAHLKGRLSTIRSKCTVLDKKWSDSGGNDPDRMERFIELDIPLDWSAYYMWLRIHEGGNLISNRLMRKVPVGNDSIASSRDHAALLSIMQNKSPGNKDTTNADNGGAIGAVARKKDRDKKRKKGSAADADGDDGFGAIAKSLEVIADPKGKAQACTQSLIRAIREQDAVMNDLSDQMDPEGNGDGKSKAYINRRRRQFREARLEKHLLQHELKALRAGHDDVSLLPPEEEPATDEDKAYYLHDPMFPNAKQDDDDMYSE